MPRTRGKQSKACQTDSVCLTEEQVENIIKKSMSQHVENIQRMQKEIRDLKSVNEKLTKENAAHGIDQLKTVLQKLQSDVTELIATTGQLGRESDALNNLQQSTEVSVETLEENVEELRVNNEEMTEKICKNTETFKAMNMKIDEIEQSTNRANLRIVGLQEDQEDVFSKVITLAREKLKIENIQASDFEKISRMGTKDSKPVRDVMVKCRDTNIRNLIYERRKNLRNNSSPIYINEDLTNYRSKLFYHARKLRKAGKLYGVWSQDGNIMVKIAESDKPTAVQSYDNLKELLQNSLDDNDFE